MNYDLLINLRKILFDFNSDYMSLDQITHKQGLEYYKSIEQNVMS